MDYASSYAIGGSPLEPRGDASSAHAAGAVLPPPKPRRVHWSTLVFAGGVAICALALLVTIAGVPARMGYDVDGPAKRNEPSSMDPAKIQASIDGNMKWIDASSADVEGGYVGYIKSINRHEAAIPAMAQALTAMDAAVQSIDAGLGQLGTATSAMGDDLGAMAETSASTGRTMQSLGVDIGFLSRSMVGLADATTQLTQRMASIERQAGSIADTGTSEALRNSKDLNAALPHGVPAPRTAAGEDYNQVMERLGTTVDGGGANGETVQ